MVVARKRRKQTNHRMLDLSGAEVVNPGSAKLAVLVDIGLGLRAACDQG
jgi:hypothetical protein